MLGTDARLEILIVDDNSPDGTGDIVDEETRRNPRVHLMRRPGKMGLGTAYRDGFGWALERDYEYIFEMDADFSHDPAHLPIFLEAAQNADFVLGSRYLDGNVTVVNWPMRRLMLSYGANIYVRIVTGMRLWDATGGFKCFRRRVLAAIDLKDVRSNGYAFQIEMSYPRIQEGLQGRRDTRSSSPIARTGLSKMNKGIMVEAIRIPWLLRWWALVGRL